MRSSPPVFALSLEAWVKVHVLVEACGGRVAGFDKLAFVFGGSLSNDGSPVPVECVAGCKTVQSEKVLLILTFDSAFMFLHACADLPTCSRFIYLAARSK